MSQDSIDFNDLLNKVFTYEESNKSCAHFSEISFNPISYINTNITPLDQLYGSGLARTTISLWGGEAGTGKTRSTVAVINNILHQGLTVLFFTLEMSSGQFVDKYCQNLNKRSNLYISELIHLDAQVELIEKVKPDLVVVDSVNKIKEYNNGRGSDTIIDKYRLAAHKANAHVLFIAQLNLSGTVKGGTDITHAVDTLIFVNRTNNKYVKVSCPSKNRYGPTGKVIYFSHYDYGVKFHSNNENKLIAENGTHVQYVKNPEIKQYTPIEDKPVEHESKMSKLWNIITWSPFGE